MAQSRKQVLKIAGGIVVVVLLAVVAMRLLQTVDHSPPPMMAHKHAQLAALQKLARQNAEFAETFNPLEREPTLRDSGRKGVGLFINNAFFRIAGGIGFDTKQLAALLIPTRTAQPVTLDDPTSFVFKPLHGSVIMHPEGLAALFNQYLNDYPRAQMRDISVQTKPDLMVVKGESSNVPGVWLPFRMEGKVELQQGHLFVYQPDKIEVAKIEAKGLLKLIRLQLSSLLQIETSGAQLQGNNVVLDLNYALPPPTQDVHISDMRIDDAGVHLQFTSDLDPEFPPPIVASDSYVMIQGGDIKTFRALLTDVRLQLVAGDGGHLDTSLYNYRVQIIDGLFDATPAGELVAYLGPYRPAEYLPAAQPEDGDDDS